MKDFVSQIENEPLVKAQPKERGSKISIKFSPNDPPEDAGVYVVYDCAKKTPKPFYVGEARNLLKRLKLLFRCNSPKNPHPCQSNYTKVIKEKINKLVCEDFCSRFKVKFLSTKNLIGRIEIEEKLQKKYKTNCDEFYKNYLLEKALGDKISNV